MRRDYDRGMWARMAEESPDPLSVLQAWGRVWDTLDDGVRGRFLGAPERLQRLARFMGASPGLVPFLVRYPGLTTQLFLDGGVDGFGLSPEDKQEFLNHCRQRMEIESLARRIARFRNTHLVRLYTQEISQIRPPQEIWRDWSDVAAWCIEGALEGCRKGLPEEGRGVDLAVIGMGKLGGAELNFASDVDLVFLYDRAADVAPEMAHQWAAQWATKITTVLEKATEEGPAFRVDLGLRPGGKDGAVVHTLEAAELYYQIQAVTWERLALIKARSVAGDARLGARFVEMVQPFVFRRYLDYGSLEDIRALKERIQREVRWRKPYPVDVKMGRGGIREVEFLLQTMQIIYGGRIPALRGRDTLGTLETLRGAGLLEQKESDLLRDAYVFMRRVEHGVQMVYHRQTHRLPVNERERDRIAGIMGYRGPEGPEAFMKDLRDHMGVAHTAFEGLLSARHEGPVSQEQPRVEEILVHLEEEQTALSLIQKTGFRQPQAVRESLRRITGEGFPAHRSPRARKVLRRLLPRILPLVLGTPGPDQTLFRMERFLEAIGPRGGYYALLEENPETLDHLIAVLGQSALLARWLTSQLDAVDALIDRGHHRPRRSKGELTQEVEALLGSTSDPEERLGRLRAIRAQEILRIGVADLWDVLTPTEVGGELTHVAEVFLEITLGEVMRAAGGDYEASGLPFCVLGLGSLGGQELSYRSDLDLILVYEGRLGNGAPGAPSGVEHLTRVGQRLISWMTMPMREGPGWPVDLRLRPSGSRGPLMVSLDGFKRYHEEQGRAWERQSLLKARFCAGDPGTGARAMEVIDEVLTGELAPDPSAMHAMRIRMEQERGGRDPQRIHLKMGPGGMADLEFLIQYYQMGRWAQHSEVHTSSTPKALERLMEIGCIGEEDGGFLKQAYTFFKGVENRLGLVLDHKGTDRPCTREDIQALGAMEGLSWVPLRGPQEALPDLLTSVMKGVRAIYLRHLVPV